MEEYEIPHSSTFCRRKECIAIYGGLSVWPFGAFMNPKSANDGTRVEICYGLPASPYNERMHVFSEGIIF